MEIRLVYYLDDICILGSNEEETKNHTTEVVSHLQNLGFLMNNQKSVLPQEFMGFLFSTQTMKSSIPSEKID